MPSKLGNTNLFHDLNLYHLLEHAGTKKLISLLRYFVKGKNLLKNYVNFIHAYVDVKYFSIKMV